MLSEAREIIPATDKLWILVLNVNRNDLQLITATVGEAY